MEEKTMKNQKLILALIKFQSKVKSIDKTAVNPFLKKGANDGKYADYQDIVSGIKTNLAECELAITHLPQESEKGSVKVLTILYHSSGESLESVLILPCDEKSQSYGSALTYAKRYQISAMLGLSIGGEDDDGEGANKNKTIDIKAEATKKVGELPDDIKELLKKKGMTDVVNAHKACLQYGYDLAKIRTALTISLSVEA